MNVGSYARKCGNTGSSYHPRNDNGFVRNVRSDESFINRCQPRIAAVCAMSYADSAMAEVAVPDLSIAVDTEIA
jgi:hypothetical protein